MATTTPAGVEVQAKVSTRWPAIESNPDVLNKFGTDIGLDQNFWVFQDVFGLDPELLALIPQPLLAILLLFPSKKKIKQVDESLRGDGKQEIFFLRQVDELDDACGTIAMIHALANNPATLKPGLLQEYLNSVRDKNEIDRGLALAHNAQLAALHSQFSKQGQTKELKEGESSGHHFVCFTSIGNDIYELDGLKPFPLRHKSIGTNFTNDVAQIILEKYMNDPNVFDFNIMALVPNTADPMPSS